MHDRIVEITLGDGVIKYVHADRSETTMKFGSACRSEVTERGFVERAPVSEKMTVFVSSSVGCQMRCRMCYLTTKGFPFEPLTSADIVLNVSSAIADVRDSESHLKPIKLSFMGMGEALLHKRLDEVCYGLMEEIDDMGSEIIGIDIGTCGPVSGIFEPMKRFVERGPTYPTRLFYSLHSPVDEERQAMMPGTSHLCEAFDELRRIKDLGVEVIFHYTPVHNVNDSNLDAFRLASLLFNERFGDAQVRLLRFNECDGSEYCLSSRFEEFAMILASFRDNVRYQVSTGSEIKAACGQFIARKSVKPV